jgi:hypothetical protein
MQIENSNTQITSDSMPVGNMLLAVRLFSSAVAYCDGYSQEAKFKSKMSFDELKNNIMSCFANGAYKVCLFEDKRKVNDILTIKKGDFSKEEVLEGLFIIDTKNKIQDLKKRKPNIIKNMESLRVSLLELNREIKRLESLLTDC